MRTHVEFRSAKFPAYPGEEEQINPGLWGKRLAEYLHAKLIENGMGRPEISPDGRAFVAGPYAPVKIFQGCVT